MKTARNVAIIMLIAALIAFAPAGANTALIVGRVLFILVSVVITVFAARFYVERRAEIFGLGDRDRLLVYAALGAIVLAFAGRPTWSHSTAGTAAFVALIVFAGFVLFTVYQRWRAY